MSRSEDEESPEETEPTPRRSRWRRRLLRWSFLLLLATAGYWIGSFAARPTAESWLSRTLGVPVKVRRVGADPIDAVLTLENLATRWPSEDGSPGRPLIAERAHVDLQWFPLVHRRIQIRELVLEGAVLELDEVPTLAPTLESLWKPSEPKTLPEGWSVQVDRLVLRDTILRLPAAREDQPPLELVLEDFEVTATRRRTSVLGAATNLRLRTQFEGGTIEGEGHYSLRDEGLAVIADFRAKDVPVERVLEYIPELGLEVGSGRLAAEMRYVLEPERRSRLSGWARVRDGAFGGTSEKPAIRVRNALADIDALDFRQRRLHVGSLVLRGAEIHAEPGLAGTLLGGLRNDSRSTSRRNAGRARPWRWAIDRFDASDALLELPSEDQALTLPAVFRGENLGPRSHWSPIEARFGTGPLRASFKGSVRTSYEEPRLEGRLSVSGLDLPTVAYELGLAGADLVKSGRVNGDIDILLEPSAAGFGMTGLVSVTGLALASDPPDEAPTPEATAVGAPTPEPSPSPSPSPEPTPWPEGAFADGVSLIDLERLETFEAGADRIDLRVHAPAPKKPRRGPPPPRRWEVDATLVGPYIHAARDETGWFLPALEPPAPRAGDDPEASPSSTPTPTPRPTPEASEAEIELPPITIGRLAVVGGSIQVLDAAAFPWISIDVTEIGGTGELLSLDRFEFQNLALQGYGADLGVVELRAFEASEWGGLEVAATDMPLYLLDPYLRRLEIPYRFAAGSGSFVSEVRRDIDGWTTDTLLILNRPQLEMWTEDAFARDRIGMSLSSAFELLRDNNGDVRIRLPRIETPHHDFDLAVADAIRNAHAAPSSGGALTPTTLGFSPGQARLRADAVADLRRMARLVAAHPQLRIELAAPASLQDRRWLTEQSLLRDLDERGGFFDAFGLLGGDDETEQIQRALRARTQGRSYPLDTYHQELLDELLAKQPPPPPAQVRALGNQRISNVEQVLLAEGISPRRLVRRLLPGDDRTTLAAVLVSVRTEPGLLPAGPPSVRPSREDGA